MKYLEYLNGSTEFLKLKITSILQSDYIYIIVDTKEGIDMVTEKMGDKTFVHAITSDKEIVDLYDESISKHKIRLMRVSIDKLIEMVIPELQRKNISGLIINSKSQVGLMISTLPKDVIIYKVIRDNFK